MNRILIYPAGSTAACGCAADFLKEAGMPLVDHPSPEVTHLLLDVPSFGPEWELRGGGRPEALLERLPPTVTVAGGNLNHRALEGYSTLDLLTDPDYLARNAAITAHCALRVALPLMRVVPEDTPVLIIGWGRIGKCLGRLLQALGAKVIIAARKDRDRAMIRALGCQAADTARLGDILPDIRLLFNTVPEPVLDADSLKSCRNCVKIDLASRAGITGTDVIWARGLPGKYAPESSGKLIAQTFLKLAEEGAL